MNLAYRNDYDGIYGGQLHELTFDWTCDTTKQSVEEISFEA